MSKRVVCFSYVSCFLLGTFFSALVGCNSSDREQYCSKIPDIREELTAAYEALPPSRALASQSSEQIPTLVMKLDDRKMWMSWAQGMLADYQDYLTSVDNLAADHPVKQALQRSANEIVFFYGDAEYGDEAAMKEHLESLKQEATQLGVSYCN